jgi:hypothetical protein
VPQIAHIILWQVCIASALDTPQKKHLNYKLLTMHEFQEKIRLLAGAALLVKKE